MARPVTTRHLKFSRKLSLRLTYQSTGEGEKRVRAWIDESAQRSGTALRTALAGASPRKSGRLAGSMRALYDFPRLTVGSTVRYARFQDRIRSALTQGAAIIDRQFRRQTRGIPFPISFSGLWTIKLHFGLVLQTRMRGILITTQTVRFADLYDGYNIIEGDEYGARFRFKMPDFTIRISGRPSVS